MQNTRRRYCAMILPILLLFAATGMQAGTITTTDLSLFLTQLRPGYQIQTFDALPVGGAVDPGITPPIDFTSGIFSYSATTGGSNFYNGDIGGGDVVLSTVNPTVITFTFTSGNVTAVGGYFWNTALDFSVKPGTIQVALSDGTTLTDPSAGPGTFFGFYSDTPIQSLTVTPQSSAIAGDSYATVNNLYLGQANNPEAIPEPATIAGVCGGLLALIALRRRVRS